MKRLNAVVVPLIVSFCLAPLAWAGEKAIALREHLNQQWTNEMVTYPFTAQEGDCDRRSVAIAGLAMVSGRVVQAEPAPLVETRGLCCVSSRAFPAPQGTVMIPIPEADFETRAKTPAGWEIQGGQIIAADDAPQGKAFCRIKAGKGGILRTPRDIAAQPGRPYFLSMWLKSPGQYWAIVSFTSEERLRTFGFHDTAVPNTGNQWKRVGYYFWMPVPCKTVQFHISPLEEGRDGQTICIAVDPPTATATEQVELSGQWTRGQGRVSTGQAGARLKIRFTGNRIDLIGRGTPGGGTVKVFIDGTPAERAAVFYTTFIEPQLKGWPRGQRGQPGDSAPHAVDLGTSLVPQTWTITMASDVGDYRLSGSVTGPDGEGNVGRPFLSTSKQIGIDPQLWRNGRVEKQGQPVYYGNRTGDTFTFDIYRCARGALGFRSAKPAPLTEPLVQNLPNGRHTLELVAVGDGEVNVEGLYVFQPPQVAEIRAPKPVPPDLAAVLQSSVDKRIIAGAVGLVADRDKVLSLDAVGYASLAAKTPMRTGNVFWIASMSKSITGTALMMLVDEGKVHIDDPVEKYLPEFKGQLVAASDKGPAHPPRHPITVKEVMSHTSGLILASDRSLKHLDSLKDNVADYASRPLRQEPGTKFEYNNCGIDTGGRIIEVVSGLPYADFMQQRLFHPLGMKDTTFWPTAEQARRLARSARFTADKSGLEEVQFDKGLTPALIQKLGQGVTVPPELLADFGGGMIPNYAHHFAEPAGGLFSTASDLGAFCQMLLADGVYHGKRYLSPQAIQEMTAIQTGGVPVNPQEAYGLGWFVKIHDAEGPSIGSFGHRGARRTVMWIDPNNRLAMILLVERWDMPGEAQKVLYGSFLKAASEKYGKPRSGPR